MNIKIDRIKKTRIALLGMVQDVTLEQLNRVPVGFNNNIIWNIGHLISTLQGICYIRSGLPVHIEEKIFLKFKSGTKPQTPVAQLEVDQLKTLFLSEIDQLESDYEAKSFGHYQSWTTRYGVEITSIEDAIEFLLFHEGLHLGYIQALMHVVKQ
ncbi:MAG: DinB family protein [Chitinophagaceae bacterium]